MAIDGISHHPTHRHLSRQGARQHALGQFGFGRKGNGLRDVRLLHAQGISAPVFGQVQLTVDQGMAQRGHVGEYVE